MPEASNTVTLAPPRFTSGKFLTETAAALGRMPANVAKPFDVSGAGASAGGTLISALFQTWVNVQNSALTPGLDQQAYDRIGEYQSVLEAMLLERPAQDARDVAAKIWVSTHISIGQGNDYHPALLSIPERAAVLAVVAAIPQHFDELAAIAEGGAA